MATAKHEILWVTGLLNGEQPCAHYISGDLTAYGWTQTHCGQLVKYGQGKTLVALQLALKFAEICQTCASAKAAQ